MALSRRIVLGMIFVACLASACDSCSTTSIPSPTTPTGQFANLSGTWTGTLESAAFPAAPITLVVVQSADCVDGAWTSSTGDWKGAISGYATEDAFGGFFSLERSASGGGQCRATGSVSGPASQSAIRLTVTSLNPVGSCVGDLPTDMVLTLQR